MQSQEPYTRDELNQLAEQAGEAFAIFMDAFFRGYARKAKEISKAEAAAPYDAEKTAGDCSRCWCDDCEKIETCANHRECVEPDGLMPSPCAGCTAGERFAPIESIPPCIVYLHSG